MRQVSKKGKIIIGSAIGAGLFLVTFILVLVLVILPALQGRNRGNQEKTFEIKSLEIQLDGRAVTEIEKPYGSDAFALAVFINGEVMNSEKKDFFVEWSFIGHSLGCVMNNGVVKVGETLGQTTIKAIVKSENEVSTEVRLKVVPKPNSVLENIFVKSGLDARHYEEGQPFSKDDYEIFADFGDYTAVIRDYTVDKKVFALGDLHVFIFYQEKEVKIPIVVISRVLKELMIKNPPSVLSYTEGQTLNLSGLEVTARYGYLTAEVTDYSIDFDRSKPLTPSDESFTITYSEGIGENQITVKAEQPITVAPKTLQRLSVDTTKAKCDYTQGQKFDRTNLIVKAVYEYSEEIITDYTVSSDCRADPRLNPADTSVIIKYGAVDFVLEIRVDKPYSEIREINIAEPYETTLSWVYCFMTDSGEDRIERNSYTPEDSSYLQRELAFNELHKNGKWSVYQIPVGATVSITSLNPAVLDFKLDHEAYGLVYPAKSINFTLERGENAIHVTAKKVVDRRTIAFSKGSALLPLSYPLLGWDGKLKESDMKKIALMFDENSKEYENIYHVGATERRFHELSGITLDTTAEFILINVESRERVPGVALTLTYWDGLVVAVTVPSESFLDNSWKTEFALERMGYTFDGWTKVTETKYTAKWIAKNPGYTQDFVGTWKASRTENIGLIQCEIILNQNGTYSYQSWLDGLLSLDITGFYQYGAVENKFTILSVDSTEDLNLAGCDDLKIAFDGTQLTADILIQLIVSDEPALCSFSVTLSKI